MAWAKHLTNMPKMWNNSETSLFSLSLTLPPYFFSLFLSVSHHLFRKPFPKGSRLRKGFFGSTVRALPGMISSTSPCMTAVKQSVVGSGPTLLPGKSCSIRYLRTNSHANHQCHHPFHQHCVNTFKHKISAVFKHIKH